MLCVLRVSFVDVAWQVSPVAISIGKTLVTVILAAHLLSCLWFWVSCHDALVEVRNPLSANDSKQTKSI